MKKKYINVNFEVKEVQENGVFSGYGSVFGNIDCQRDMVMKGAFLRTLSEHNLNNTFPLMLYSHYLSKEIGEWLSIKEDDYGLFCKGQLWIDGKHPDQDALKAYRGMKKKKNKMGLSIGYYPYEGGEEYVKEGEYWRLKDIELFEISPTPLPANELARVESVKSIESERDFERFLRDSGFSRSQAVKITANGYKSAQSQRDSDDELIESTQSLIKIIGGN